MIEDLAVRDVEDRHHRGQSIVLSKGLSERRSEVHIQDILRSRRLGAAGGWKGAAEVVVDEILKELISYHQSLWEWSVGKGSGKLNDHADEGDI